METRIFYIILISALFLGVGCTEEYDIKSEGFESVLVVESTITDEMKQQIVKLSRTSTLDTNAILFENNATVNVLGSNGEEFTFSQNSDTGYYVSDQEFSAQPNISYTLKINTQEGKHYTSSEVVLPPSINMDEVYAERIVTTVDDKDGIEVLVNTEDPTGNAKYFRYEYEETYKIIAPYPSPYTAEIINFDDEFYTFEVVLSPREPEIICYSTEYSTGINQTTTSELTENRVVRFPVKYLSKLDAKIQARYSILVKQYVQSVEAYTFYKVLKELGSVASLLSQNQPGYVAGNMVSEANPDEKVLGFFEASSMTSKRIYFNYEDFGLEKPPYFIECEMFILDYNDNTELDNDPNERQTLFTYISYFDYQVVSFYQGTLYKIVQPECSVCTYFSSNIKPDFWED